MKIGRESTTRHRNAHGATYREFDNQGYTVIEVLPFLVGRPCDDVAMAYIAALRPSYIRITTGERTCDARIWRVTVVVDENDIIQRVEQEVNVGLPEPFGCGWELDQYIKTGEHKPLPEGGLAIYNMRVAWKIEFEDEDKAGG